MADSLRIAVADDEPLIRQYFAETLADLGHDVVAAVANGRQLVEACRQHPVDLIVTDIKMPEMDGIDAALEINQERTVPVILVSAFHDEDLLERAVSSRIMAYLVKPIERADLVAAIAVARKRFAELHGLEQETQRLRQSLEDRKLIERAKGILMDQTGMKEPDAHRRMQRLATDRNMKLIDIARTILSAAPALELFKKAD
jgi:response regulator NasT